MKERKPRQRPQRKKLLRNRYLVSFRDSRTGKARSIRCCAFKIFDTSYAVTWKDGKDSTRRFTEWLNRDYWTLITPEERQANYIKKETARVAKEREKLAKRLAKRDPAVMEVKRQEKLRKHREYMREYLKKYRARQKTETVEAPTPEVEKPRITNLEVVLPPTPVEAVTVSVGKQDEPTSPDVLTPAEEATLKEDAPKVAGAGDVNRELPGEYNAQFHLKNDKHPWGDPTKLAVFDAMVTSEATMREAKIRIEQARARRAINETIEKTGAGWTSG